MILKILIVTQYFSPENFRINDVAKILSLNGHAVTVLTGCPNYPEGSPFDGYSASKIGYEKYYGCIVHRVPIITRGKSSSFRILLNYLSFILSGILFGPFLLRGKKYDLVFVYAPSPIFQAIIGIYFKYLTGGAPLITWVQDLWPECLELTGHIKNKKILNFVSSAVSWVYKKNDLLLAQSNSFIPSIEAKAGKVPVKYFPNPGEAVSNSSQLNLSVALQNFFLESGFNVVFAGNLGTVQSLPTILRTAEILREFPNIRILLVGSGSLSPWLEKQVESRGLKNIILAGRFPADAMPAIFERASALLVSLNADPVLNQTVPAKLQSYLAAGKPIIASLDGEGAQIVAEANAGLVCPAEDPNALAQTILKLSTFSQEQLASMGKSGKHYFSQNFEPQARVKELTYIFMESITKVMNKRNNE